MFYNISEVIITVNITLLRHAYPEANGLTIDRPNGHGDYTFLHFFQSVDILIGGKKVKTNPGAIIIYDKTTPQYFHIKEPLVHNWIHMTGNLPEMLNKYDLSLDTLYYSENSAFITELVYELEAELYGKRSGREELIQLKLEELIIKLSRSVHGQSIPILNDDSKKKFQLLRSEMLSKLSHHFKTSEMASKVGFSESRFYRIYQSLYGISPTEDLINARIEKAKNMLFYEKLSVSETAEALGYENITHFIRQFKSKTKFSPTEYRKSQNSKLSLRYDTH